MTVNGHISSLGKKSISQPILHAAYRAHEVWDIFFHPAQFFQRPCNVCTPCFYLKEVWFLGKASFSCFEQYPFFFPPARCFKRQGAESVWCRPWGGRGGLFIAQTSGGASLRYRSSRLLHNNKTDKTGGRKGKEAREGEWRSGLCGGNLNIYCVKMTMSVPERKSGSEGKEEESEDESEILEESPCGRWQKRKEQVGPSVCVYVCVCVKCKRSAL